VSADTIILVHGLWMTGAEMSLLKRRLRARGYQVHQFRYRMVTRSLQHNRAQLKSFIEKFAAGSVHIVGHSLGGVLALQTLQQYPDLPVQSVICLGSPLVDSAAGRRVAQLQAGRAILGKTLPEAVFETPLQTWSGPQCVGVVAGNRGFGLGKFVGSLPKPNDGVVSVAETCLPGITDHLEVARGHMGMLLSRVVAAQCAWFIRHGKFRRNLARS
jgi:pimeloyl-ACP methyl ester carboxylesterase